MTAPKVSVIVPSYNHDRYLSQRIRSVLDQTFRDFEVLILDDASTDESGTVIAGYRDHPKVRVFLSETNSGSPFHQWNKGVNLARGQYVWIAEADDDADPRLLETLVSRLDRDDDVALAYCQSWVIDEAGNRIHTADRWADDLSSSAWKHDRVSDGQEELARYLVVRNTIPNVSAVVFRRDAYLAAGSAPENLRLCGDWMMWAKMLNEGRLAFVAEPLNMFRYHGSSVRASTPLSELCAQNYEVRAFICRTAAVSDETRSQAAREAEGDWWQAVRRPNHKTSWRWAVRTASLAGRLQRRAMLRLLLLYPVGCLLRSPAGKAALGVVRRLTRTGAPEGPSR